LLFLAPFFVGHYRREFPENVNDIDDARLFAAIGIFFAEKASSILALILDAVHGVGNVAARRRTPCTKNQTITSGDIPFVDTEQVGWL